MYRLRVARERQRGRLFRRQLAVLMAVLLSYTGATWAQVSLVGCVLLVSMDCLRYFSYDRSPVDTSALFVHRSCPFLRVTTFVGLMRITHDSLLLLLRFLTISTHSTSALSNFCADKWPFEDAIAL